LLTTHNVTTMAISAVTELTPTLINIICDVKYLPISVIDKIKTSDKNRNESKF